ncbi:carbohydrate ABC transporter permease, partial [Streptomyces phaeochromogenes]
MSAAPLLQCRRTAAVEWQIYVPLGIYLLFTLIPFYWILLFAL